MSAGQISAAMLAVPNAFQAQDAGFNLIGQVADIFRNYLLSAYSVRRSLAEKGLDYYLTNQAWHPELEIEMDGLRTVVDIYAEQTGMKGAIPSPEKYVDQSYLRQALKELGLR